jgi:hypothetical protein
LSGAKRNSVLELWEVQRYGVDSYDDPDYVSVYGMRPAEGHEKGIRLLGRTAVECTRDSLGDAIGKDVAAVAEMAPQLAPTLVVDLFAGSGNTLYWLGRHLPDARVLGFELDAGVFELTRQNLAALALPVEILNKDYRSGARELCLTAGQLLIAFVAPPWGEALDRTSGLDLRRTTPPVNEIVNFLFDLFTENPLLCVTQIYEAIDSGSLTELRALFDWSALHFYTLNAPGENHGILLGSKRWTPEE